MRSSPRVLLLFLITAVVAGGSFVIGQRIYDARRWSGYPHSMGCVIEASDDEMRAAGLSAYPPPAVQLVGVALTYLGDNRLQISVDFRESVPLLPTTALSPYSRKPVDAPGSISYQVVLYRPQGGEGAVQIFSPTNGRGWIATQGEYVINPMIGEPVPESYDPNRNLAESARVRGKSLEVVLDLDGIPGLFSHGPFRPAINFIAQMQGMPSATLPEGSATLFDPQKCDWATPARGIADPRQTASGTSPSPEPSIRLPAAPPLPGEPGYCGAHTDPMDCWFNVGPMTAGEKSFIKSTRKSIPGDDTTRLRIVRGICSMLNGTITSFIRSDIAAYLGVGAPEANEVMEAAMQTACPGSPLAIGADGVARPA